MKKFLFLSVIGILSTSTPAFSQANNAAYNLNTRQINLEQQRAAFGLTEFEFNNIEGSPYANESFLVGVINQEDKSVYDKILLRYNIFADEIEIKKSGNSSDSDYDALIKDPKSIVKIANSIYVFVPFEGSMEKGHYFTVVLEEIAFDLYKKTEVDYSKPYKAKTSYERDRPAKFTQKNSYYLVSKNGTFYELPDSKSKIIKVMSSKEVEVKSYIKKNKLDISSENDLVKLVKFYNSLL
jgi:hypothetical protein